MACVDGSSLFFVANAMELRNLWKCCRERLPIYHLGNTTYVVMSLSTMACLVGSSVSPMVILFHNVSIMSLTAAAASTTLPWNNLPCRHVAMHFIALFRTFWRWNILCTVTTSVYQYVCLCLSICSECKEEVPVAEALDANIARRLWDVSIELVHLTNDQIHSQLR